jgi:RNase P subunit RPR2
MNWNDRTMTRTATMTTVPQPTAETRWRCTLCGNLTRFDVTRSSKVVEYVHLDLAGEPTVEEREVVSETIESVRCRWCNAVDRIELVDRPGAGS